MDCRINLEGDFCSPESMDIGVGGLPWSLLHSSLCFSRMVGSHIQQALSLLHEGVRLSLEYLSKFIGNHWGNCFQLWDFPHMMEHVCVNVFLITYYGCIDAYHNNEVRIFLRKYWLLNKVLDDVGWDVFLQGLFGSAFVFCFCFQNPRGKRNKPECPLWWSPFVFLQFL